MRENQVMREEETGGSTADTNHRGPDKGTRTKYIT